MRINDDGSVTSNAAEPVYVKLDELFPPSFGIGRLGAICSHTGLAAAAQADMIERRLLRIEIALRRAGIEVEALQLPD